MKIKEFTKIATLPLGLAGASIGMGLVGDAFNSTGLKQGGEVAGKFIPVTVGISMSSIMLKQLKEMKKK